MRVWRSPVAAATLVICANALVAPLQAQVQTKVIGSWQILVDQDPFRAGPRVIAVTGSGPVRLAVRCNAGKLTIDLGDVSTRGPFLTGEEVAIKFRTDQRPIIDAVGSALDDRRLRIEGVTEMVRQMLGATEIAFRITKPRSWQDLIYQPLKSDRALVPVITACPLR